jgi:predicted small metal-binding protein
MAQISIIQYSQVSDFSGRIDAEFYKPISLYADQAIKNMKHQKLGSMVEDGYRVVYENTKILAVNKVNPEKDVRFLQATNISNDGLWIDANEIGYVSYKDWDRYPKGRIQPGEVLIEVKGQAEKVTIVQDYVPMRTLVTGTVFKLNLKKETISPDYLFAFFSSTYGKILRDRTKVNTLIAYVSKPELYSIPIPIFDKENHQLITEYVQSSFELQIKSKNLYSQATQILEQELGLDKISFEKPRSYTARLSEVIDFSRFDSEHYQPKYQKYRELIMAYSNGYERLLTNVKAIKPDYQLKNHPEKIINYIELSKINAGLGVIENIVSIDKNAAPSRAKRFVKSGDVIASSVIGSVEKSALVSELEDGYIASNGFFQFRSDVYSPEFLLLLVKSQFFKEQLHQQSTGGILSAVPDQNLRYLIIPKVKKEVQDEITEKIKKSHQMNRESKNLLEQAKTRVEELIEQSIEANA